MLSVRDTLKDQWRAKSDYSDYAEYAEADSSLYEPQLQRRIHAFEETMLLYSEMCQC